MAYNFEWEAGMRSGLTAPITAAALAAVITAEKAVWADPKRFLDVESGNAAISRAVAATAEVAFAAAWADIAAGRPGNATLVAARLIDGAENRTDYPDTADKAVAEVRKRAQRRESSCDKGPFAGFTGFHD